MRSTSTLSVAEQQLVEIAKSLNRKTRILMMDEPSAVLGEKDLEKLFQVVRSLQAQGHRHHLHLSPLERDLRAGRRGHRPQGRALRRYPRVSDVTMDDLVMMIGRDLKDVYPKRITAPSDVLLEVSNVSQPSCCAMSPSRCAPVRSSALPASSGSGRTELARGHLWRRSATGEMRMPGSRISRIPPRMPSARGGPGDRGSQGAGLFLKLNVAVNTTISGLKQLCRIGVIQFSKESILSSRMIQDLSIKTPGTNFLVVNMSGGNQQKVVLARWLSIGTRIFILDEPTRGIDVGSKSEIYQIMDGLTKRAWRIIMISSELPEILGMSDRIMVMRQGTIVKELSRAEASEEAIMKYAVGSEGA